MKTEKLDVRLASLVQQIKDGEIDLQPDFQRTEVWAESRQQRLIDSLLRRWHIPPIHVVETADNKWEVLDGQQRLQAIRRFFSDELSVDGSIEPMSRGVRALDGRMYSELPKTIRRRLDSYTLRVFVIEEYEPQEPAELFFRLNLSVSLTSAEQRNAFVGRSRNQIKHLVAVQKSLGLDERFLGFKNSRLAYDDVLARSAIVIERGTLLHKVTALDLSNKYRKASIFKGAAATRLEASLKSLASIRDIVGDQARFNKATLFTWLLAIDSFHAKKQAVPVPSIAAAIWRLGLSTESAPNSVPDAVAQRLATFDSAVHRKLADVFLDRATSRVADTSSVLLRDFIAMIFISADNSHRINRSTRGRYCRNLPRFLRSLENHRDRRSVEHEALEFISKSGWGASL